MKLLNFAVGQVQTVRIGDESVRTAHVKEPIPEPWIITEEGALGDQRAVHPDKIYAYARSAYNYWGEYLNVDPTRWPDGFFGENLTFDFLDEDELRIGDIFALGHSVRLVVAGPRNPCLKLSWRLGQAPTFQKIFQKSHHTGVYFGVIATGVVRPGDVARRIERNPAMPSVAETAEFGAGHVTPPLEPLRRLLEFTHLSRTIRHILHAKLDAAERAAAATEGRWRGWRRFIIDRIVEEAPQILSYYLIAEDGQCLCQPKPGQFVTVQLNRSDGGSLTRTWSLSSYAYNLDHYRLTVRRQEGPGSRRLHELNVGASLDLRAPSGNFVLDMGGFRPVVLIAAGIGITPLYAMLQAHLARGDIGAPIYVIYGGKTPSKLAFRAELDALAAANPSLRVTYFYSNSDEGNRPAGRITPQWVIDFLADNHVMLGDRRIPLPWFENDTYLCGPGAFCAEIKDELIARGANADHIFYELFSTVATVNTELEAADVYFRRSNVHCNWTADVDLSLLELAEQAGIVVPNECRAGACLSCKTIVLDGLVTADLGDGSALLCIGRPKTPRLILDC